jgi:hypothetical protein
VRANIFVKKSRLRRPHPNAVAKVVDIFSALKQSLDPSSVTTADRYNANGWQSPARKRRKAWAGPIRARPVAVNKKRVEWVEFSNPVARLLSA